MMRVRRRLGDAREKTKIIAFGARPRNEPRPRPTPSGSTRNTTPVPRAPITPRSSRAGPKGEGRRGNPDAPWPSRLFPFPLLPSPSRHAAKAARESAPPALGLVHVDLHVHPGRQVEL